MNTISTSQDDRKQPIKDCQVFTPKEYVNKLLDIVGYKNNLYGKKIAENSCGSGNILSEIVQRYIVDSLKNNISLEKIKQGLEDDIWGAEIDVERILECEKKLDNIATKYSLPKINWNIFKGDFLKENIIQKFDFVVGNPPYIAYRDLTVDNRVFIRNNFETCKNGRFDYYYAFIEASIKSLKNNGKLVYLIPSSVFKNEFAFDLREYILPYITNIYDYTSSKLFKRLISSSIIVCDKHNPKELLYYHDVNSKITKEIIKTKLTKKWLFKEETQQQLEKDLVRFGDHFHAANSIATLLNKAYILTNVEKYNEEYIKIKNHKIEKSIVKKSRSARLLKSSKDEYIIFPYYYEECKLKRYHIEEFENKFPFAVKYMKQFEQRLQERDSDKGINWFEYGRSQAISHLNQPKLLMSTIITKSVHVGALSIDEIPTSGLYIINKAASKFSLQTAKKILESKLFFKHVENTGIITNSHSFRINAKDVNNFVFPKYYLDKY